MKKVGQEFRERLVNRVKAGLDENPNVFLLSYSQVSSLKISDLRKQLASSGAGVYVSKNSIAQIALKDFDKEDLAKQVTGQTAFIWSREDAASIAKILVDFAKECENVKIQGGLLEGKILNEADVKVLSELPSRDVLLSMLLSTIQAPVSRLMGAFNSKTRDVLSILKQLSEKKGGS